MFCMGATLQLSERRPAASQLPCSLAAVKTAGRRPVRYRKRTCLDMSEPRPALLSRGPERDDHFLTEVRFLERDLEAVGDEVIPRPTSDRDVLDLHRSRLHRIGRDVD